MCPSITKNNFSILLPHLYSALVYSKWTCSDWRRAWAVKGFIAVLCCLLSQLLRARGKICSVFYPVLGIPNEANVCQPLQLSILLEGDLVPAALESLCNTKMALSHFCIHIPLQGAPSVPHLSQNTAQSLLMWTAGLAALESDFSPCLREAHLFFCVWACFPLMSWSDAVFLDDWYSSFLPDVWGSVCFCFVSDEGIWKSSYRSLIKKKILFFGIETYFFIAHLLSAPPSARSDGNSRHWTAASVAGVVVPSWL